MRAREYELLLDHSWCLHRPSRHGHLGVAGLFNREPRSLPFGIPVFQARGLAAALAQLGYGLIRENTIGSAAVRYDMDRVSLS